MLIKTINEFNFIKAQPVDNSFKKELPPGIDLYGLKIEGEDYLFYWVKNKIVAFERWSVPVPAGNYSIEWVDPINGSVLKQQKKQHAGGILNIDAASFTDDSVLRIKLIN